MNLQELQQRIGQGETLHSEFKAALIHRDKLSASLVAFANTDGGQLIFGIRDKDYEIVGVADPDAIMRQVDNLAYQNCEPPLTIVQETVTTEDGRIVVVVNIPKGDRRPYRTNKGVYYIRTTSGRRQASRQELLRLFQATSSLYYDETPVQRATLDDLAIKTIKEFFEETRGYSWSSLGLTFERTLINLKLASKSGDRLYPTLAGILFFGYEPQHFVPHSYITAARFNGNSLAEEPSDGKQLDGPMQVVLEDAMRFLKIHLPTPHHIHDMQPEAIPELPTQALREALVNALAHRDYTIQSPVRLFIFDDRVEIRSPGGLPNTVTLESLPLGIHVLRNPIIYNIFLRLGLVTDAGSGIPRIIARVKENTGRVPTFKLEGNEFVVTLSRKTVTTQL